MSKRFAAPWSCAFLVWIALVACKPTGPSPNTGQGDPVKTLGSVEVIARLVEIPEGAIFQRDLYDYATILKYEVISGLRGPVEKGATLYIGQYNPWKPRNEAADARVKNIGGKVQRFRAGDLHHMALEASLDDHFMGGVVDKYYDRRTGPAYWAVWTNPAK
jgi:hypothetical protein